MRFASRIASASTSGKGNFARSDSLSAISRSPKRFGGVRGTFARALTGARSSGAGVGYFEFFVPACHACRFDPPAGPALLQFCHVAASRCPRAFPNSNPSSASRSRLQPQPAATQAEADASLQKGLNVTVRLGEVETVEYQRDRGLGITVDLGRRKGSASTGDLAPGLGARHGCQSLCDRARARHPTIAPVLRIASVSPANSRTCSSISSGVSRPMRRSSWRAIAKRRDVRSMRGSRTPKARASAPRRGVRQV
jgi:hypothetical protein